MRSVIESYRGERVRVFRLDGEGAIARLRDRAQQLLRDRPDIIRVVLFGSLARGDARPGSDADLLVVIEESAVPFLDRIPELLGRLRDIGIGCDLLVYTRKEMERLRQEDGRFIRTVTREGVVLAERGG